MTQTPPEAIAELRSATVQTALAAWRALPDDERNGERPYIMGFNAGWDEAIEQAAATAQAEPGTYPHGNQMFGSAVGPKIAKAIRTLKDHPR